MFWTVGFWADSPFFVYENRKEIRMKKKDTNRLIIDNYAFAKIGNRKVDLNPKLKQKFIDETRNLPITEKFKYMLRSIYILVCQLPQPVNGRCFF